MMHVTVVIPFRDDLGALQRCLGGLVRQSQQPQGVVVANAGLNAIPDEVRQIPDLLELQIGPAMPGASRNAGAKAAQTEWIAFLDSGTEPVPTWVAAFAEAAESAPGADVLYGTYTPRIEDDWDWAAAASYLAPPDTDDLGRHPTSASLCVRRRAWQRLGGMQEDLRAGEDLLFFESVRKGDVESAVVSGARVTWDLPRGPRGHFRRLRGYSRATWPTTLSRHWHRPVLLMYLGALSVMGVSLATYAPLTAIVALLAIARVAKTMWRRWDSLPRPLTMGRLAKAPVMLAIADLATLAGIIDAVRNGTPRHR